LQKRRERKRNRFDYNSKIPSYVNDLARPSVWLPLEDEAFQQKFEAVWEEHIEGFKKRKRSRTDKDLNMEWRKRLAEKKQSQVQPKADLEVPIEQDSAIKNKNFEQKTIETILTQQKYREMKKSQAEHRTNVQHKPENSTKRNQIIGPSFQFQKTQVRKAIQEKPNL